MSTPARPRGQGDERSWSVLELLRWTTSHFAERGIESARLDAECLLAHALGSTRMQLYIDFEKPVSTEERAEFRELVRKRAGERVPVSQLLGRREFWSLPLRVTSDVLTPRPETETLVQAALDRIPAPEAEVGILDLCTGSGAIALALAQERPKSHIVATDISEAALQIAAANAEELRSSERIRFLSGDLFEPVAGEIFDLVVANPPYLAEGEAGNLPPELRHEPGIALFGGDDGLAVLRRLIAGVPQVLAQEGWCLVEIAPDQAQIVSELFAEAGLARVQSERDLAGRIRVIAASRLQRG